MLQILSTVIGHIGTAHFCDLLNKVKLYEPSSYSSFYHLGKLQDLGCFSNVGIHIDTSSTGNKDYVVTYEVCYSSYKRNFTYLIFIDLCIKTTDS